MLEPAGEPAAGREEEPPSPEWARFAFQARHPRWEGRVTLTRDGKFHRESGLLLPGDAGRWAAEGGVLHLCWEDWEPEVLRSGDGGLSFADAKGFTLTAERVPQWFSSLLRTHAPPAGAHAQPPWPPPGAPAAPTDASRAASTSRTQRPPQDDDDDDAEPIPSEGLRQPATPRSRPVGPPWHPACPLPAPPKTLLLLQPPRPARARRASAAWAREASAPPSAERVCTAGATASSGASAPAPWELTCVFARGRDVGTLPRAAKTVEVLGDRLQVFGREHQHFFFERLLGDETGPLRFVSRSHFALEPVEGPHAGTVQLTNLSSNPLHVAGRRVAQNAQATLRPPVGIDFLEGAGATSPDLRTLPEAAAGGARAGPRRPPLRRHPARSRALTPRGAASSGPVPVCFSF
ncbi:unnamed protein product [Prorocentrum cordatum]|nr:unnamed protein product [Polarella glacialis]